MAVLKPILLLALAATVSLSACARSSNNGMLHLRSTGTGPDEFAILPTKPLVLPKDLNGLPTPTLGGTNLADPTPNLDATIALGGNARSFNQSGVPKSDLGMISTVSRYGVSANIRAELAVDDVEFRRTHRGKLLERLLGVSTYFSAYEPMTLNRYAELRRLRRAGIRTPAAPPQ